jgi:hypothetical protein
MVEKTFFVFYSHRTLLEATRRIKMRIDENNDIRIDDGAKI